MADLTVAYATTLIVVGWLGGYFWLADRKEGRESRAPVQEMDVLVNRGFHPARVVLTGGRPIRLHFTRVRDGESWWDDLEFPYGRVRREIPEGKTITVDLGVLDPGEYAFFGGEGAIRGTLVVEGERDT